MLHLCLRASRVYPTTTYTLIPKMELVLSNCLMGMTPRPTKGLFGQNSLWSLELAYSRQPITSGTECKTRNST